MEFAAYKGLSLWLVDSHLFSLSSHGLLSGIVMFLIFSFFKDASHIGLGPAHMTCF